MASVSKSAEIPAPRQEVWAKLTDHESHGDWLSTHVGYPDGPPAELAPEVTYREKVTIMGMPGEVVWTVVSVEEEAHLEMKGQGPMGTQLSATYRLEDNGDGTSVTFESGFEGAALAAMEGPLTSASEKALTESLEKLQQQLS